MSADGQLVLDGLGRAPETSAALTALRDRFGSVAATATTSPRADAARRLPPLQDGARDHDIPWTYEPPARGELVVEVGPRFTAWLQGNVRRVIPLLDAVGCSRQWDHSAGAWSFPRARVDDVLARADLEKRRIRLRQVDR